MYTLNQIINFTAYNSFWRSFQILTIYNVAVKDTINQLKK